jgi:tetratricopeptide (TPR) repeat protein
MALTDLGRFNDALESYDQALVLEPSSAGVWNSKGALLMELGRLEPALACFERALSLSAAVTAVKAVYWLNKGKTLYMLGRYQEARDALVRSNQLDPSPESAAGIAACHEQLDLTTGESVT